MDTLTFWKLIDRSRKIAGGDPEEQIEVLVSELAKLPTEDIIEFEKIFSTFHDNAYDWRLWGAAYVIGGGCSDDGFADFRGWLISRGVDSYNSALQDPDSLVKIVKEYDGECQIEGFQYVASRAWEVVTGDDMENFPWPPVARRREPTGSQWAEEELDEMFPKLIKKFG